MTQAERNRKSLEKIKNSIASECKLLTYKFGSNDIEPTMREPNEYEIRAFMISFLRTVYREYPKPTEMGFIDPIPLYMDKSTYYTLKGHIKRGQIDPVRRHLRKFHKMAEFDLAVDKYKHSKCIYETKVNIQFSQPVELAVLEINLNKEEDK